MRFHLVFSVRLHGLIHHLFVQVAAADEVEVEKLEVLWRSVWIDSLEEVIDFLVGFNTHLLDVLVVLHSLVQDLILVESCESRLPECKSHLIAQIELIFRTIAIQSLSILEDNLVALLLIFLLIGFQVV